MMCRGYRGSGTSVHVRESCLWRRARVDTRRGQRMFVSNTTWTFWNVFFLMFVWIPLTIVWVFAIFDVFRQRALSGLAKAAWLVLIVILPLIGTLCYLIFRPADAW